MANIGSLHVDLSVDAGRFIYGMKQGASAVRDLRTEATSLAPPVLNSKSIISAASSALAPFTAAATAAGYALLALGNRSLESIDALGKMADRIGTTSESLRTLQHAGELSGVGIEGINTALQKMETGIGKAVSGAKGADAAFAKLGLSAKELQKADASDAFQQIGKHIAALPTPAQRAAAAVEIFGKSGAELLPLFSEGGDAIRRARQDVVDFGAAVSRADFENIATINDEATRAELALEGLGNRMTSISGLASRVWSSVKLSIADAFTADVVELNPLGVATEAMSKQVAAAAAVRRAQQQAADAARNAAKDEADRAERVRQNVTLQDAVIKKTEEYADERRRLDAELRFGQTELANIEAQRGDDLTQQQADYLAGEAKVIDALREQVKVKKEQEEADKKAAEAAKQYAKAQEDNLASIADGVRSENLTPLEKYQDKLRELKGALDAGFISQQDFNRAALNAENSLASDLALPDNKPRFAGVAEQGSREAFSAINDFKTRGPEQGKDLKTLIDVARRQQLALDEIARQTREKNALTFAEF